MSVQAAFKAQLVQIDSLQERQALSRRWEEIGDQMEDVARQMIELRNLRRRLTRQWRNYVRDRQLIEHQMVELDQAQQKPPALRLVRR